MSYAKARQKLSRIRCVLQTIQSLQQEQSRLPYALCFVPCELQYVLPKDADCTKELVPLESPAVARVKVFANHDLASRVLGYLDLTKDSMVCATGEEFSNGYGDWIALTENYMRSCPLKDSGIEPDAGWILLQPRRVDNFPVLVLKQDIADEDGNADTEAESLFTGIASTKKPNKYKSWISLVEDTYILQRKGCIIPPNDLVSGSDRLSRPLPNWDIDCDEELARFLVETTTVGEGYLFGGANKYIESIDVSTASDLSENLVDGDPDTFWESDGTQGRHYIRLHMKNGVVIQRLLIGVDASDDNFMPYRISVHGRTQDGESRQLNETLVNLSFTGNVCVLENAVEFYKVIEIKIKECRDEGIDCRIHGIKIISSKHKQLGLNRDLFDGNLVRYPKLEAVNRDLLYARGQALLRFVALLDSVIHFMLPTWEYTVGTFSCLECIRQLLPLSRKRAALIENCLRDSQSNPEPMPPKVYLNRHTAAEHLVSPKRDPSAHNALFNQLFDTLRPEKCGMKLDYRWAQKYDQWWECKFIGEGIIDQGGGFRDSLVDISEELSPSSMDSPVPLPFFIRSPNQLHDSSNVNRDGYVPNHSCLLFKKFDWIGLLMGACLRSKEHLILSFPPFIWKQLVDEKITWEKDYITVDAAEVRLHETLCNIDEETFNDKFYGLLTYTTVLCDNTIVDLKQSGSECFVEYGDHHGYMTAVQEVRMSEFKAQIAAIKGGLLRSVPKAVLDLLTWQELEKRVCGDPEVSIDALHRSAHYDDINEDDPRVKYLWAALEKFTNEDRSRLLRFITGRRRLPTPLYILPSKPGSPIDSLPESATCSNTLFLPPYSSAKVAEEKLRYAAYNCVAIDADMNPWEE